MKELAKTLTELIEKSNSTRRRNYNNLSRVIKEMSDPVNFLLDMMAIHGSNWLQGLDDLLHDEMDTERTVNKMSASCAGVVTIEFADGTKETKQL